VRRARAFRASARAPKSAERDVGSASRWERSTAADSALRWAESSPRRLALLPTAPRSVRPEVHFADSVRKSGRSAAGWVAAKLAEAVLDSAAHSARIAKARDVAAAAGGSRPESGARAQQPVRYAERLASVRILVPVRLPVLPPERVVQASQSYRPKPIRSRPLAQSWRQSRKARLPPSHVRSTIRGSFPRLARVCAGLADRA
jgi:hypothetical protein